jgi:hypothetical protein
MGSDQKTKMARNIMAVSLKFRSDRSGFLMMYMTVDHLLSSEPAEAYTLPPMCANNTANLDFILGKELTRTNSPTNYWCGNAKEDREKSPERSRKWASSSQSGMSERSRL